MHERMLVSLREEDLAQFKRDMQQAFQIGAEAFFEEGEEEFQILPEEDINRSLQAKGSHAYAAMEDGCLVGGAIVVIDEETQHNHLDFLYVKHGIQSKGVGQFIWQEIEKMHPETRVWETVTPCFEKRNIHFYVNRCGFHIVEYMNRFQRDADHRDEEGPDDEMFRFQKVM